MLKISVIKTKCQMVWPPEYWIKRHRRARCVRLRAAKRKGLEITVPYRFSLRHIPAILEEHKDWIIKQLSQLQANSDQHLPTHIHLHAQTETWQIGYHFADAKLKLLEQPHYQIVMKGDIHNQQYCKQKLVQWIKQQAKQRLLTRLQQLSQHTQLFYEQAGIRSQTTRWGSCSARRKISLNYKLIFLPDNLMNYVIIHELCHIKHLNHSAQFWELVAQYDPAWREHKRALREAEKFIPGWV